MLSVAIKSINKMKDKPVILIILGASGDLVERYILPGIVSLTNKKKITPKI